MRLPTWGAPDDNQSPCLQRAQAVADMALIASQRLDELIVAQYGPTLGPPIFSHQALQAVALQP